MPLGAAALAGTPWPIERETTRELLGFEAVCENSLDAVSDRDFAIEFSSERGAVSRAPVAHRRGAGAVDLGPVRLRVGMPDRFCTGSSIMPQKKNPDVPELVRGKSGRAVGNLVALLTLMKGQPLAYNKDNQEDKEPLFDSADTLEGSAARVRRHAAGDRAGRRRGCARRRARGSRPRRTWRTTWCAPGLAFRDAHEVVGRAVRHGVEAGRDLSEMSLETLRGFDARIGEDVFDVLTLEGSVAARSHVGGHGAGGGAGGGRCTGAGAAGGTDRARARSGPGSTGFTDAHRGRAPATGTGSLTSRTAAASRPRCRPPPRR